MTWRTTKQHYSGLSIGLHGLMPLLLAAVYACIELPALVGPDNALATQLKTLHETAGTAGYFLIGLHAAAALFHHYFVRDNTLLRMLPPKA